MTCLWHMSCMFASSNPLPTGSTYTPTDPRFPVRSAKKFPGYTSSNLSEKGVHEVSQRRFVLVAADHPIVSAISENAEYVAHRTGPELKPNPTRYSHLLPSLLARSKLQMGEISMMCVPAPCVP